MNNLENKYKIILLQTMIDFIKLCEEYNLKYVAAFGTVLGAIRHKGLIPWDDDIDVYMPRKDYEELLKLKDTLQNTTYQIFDITDDNYYLPYAKFCNKNTSLWEVKELPCIIGTFIDIFPVDEINIKSNNVFEIYKSYKNKWNK